MDNDKKAFLKTRKLDMIWNYRVVKTKSLCEDVQYGIHEVYYNAKDDEDTEEMTQAELDKLEVSWSKNDLIMVSYSQNELNSLSEAKAIADLRDIINNLLLATTKPILDVTQDGADLPVANFEVIETWIVECPICHHRQDAPFNKDNPMRPMRILCSECSKDFIITYDRD